MLPLVGYLNLPCVYALARHCHSVAVSPRLNFMCTNEYPFINRHNPCANSCLLPLATAYALLTTMFLTGPHKYYTYSSLNPCKIVQNNRHFPVEKARTPAEKLTYSCRVLYKVNYRLEIQMPFKLCSVLCRRCKSSLSTYAPHCSSVYSVTALLQ